MSRIVGIDLGTTNSCVAVVEGGRPLVIPNKHGYATTPSVLAVTEDGGRLVGQLAVRQAVTNARNTVQGSKRLLGRTWGSEEVEHARAHASFEIVEGPHDDVRIVLAGREHSVPELSAMILQELRLVAEDHLRHAVDRAVITVPAYFNDAQRQAVRDAGRIAGLEVVRILNEPTAAALAYGHGSATKARTVAVYDLGGGTFDLSIVAIEGGELHVIATTGDSFLGGEDFDERVMSHLIEGFEAQHGIDLRASHVALARIREAAQKAKTELSTLATTKVSLPFIVIKGPRGALNLERTLSRAELEEITGDLIDRTLSICAAGLDYAQLAPDAIDDVILVGGMTRMPAVQRAVREFFGRDPSKNVHPDEVVALGAALAADAIANERTNVRLHDVTAHSLGIMTAGGGFDVLIPANTPVPTRVTNVFGTSRDGQTTVKIVVLQGESARAAENHPLGRFALTGLRPAPAGEIEIEVTFRIDEDGMFSAGAKDLETGEERTIEVLASSGLSEDEIARMMRDSADYLATRRDEEASEAARQACKVAIEELRKVLPLAREKVSWTPVGAAAIDGAEREVAAIERAIADADAAALAQHEVALGRVRNTLEKAMKLAP